MTSKPLSQKAIDYACRDADATLRLYRQYRPRLEAEGLWDCYRVTLDTLPLICAMQQTGWRIDEPYCLSLLGQFDLDKTAVQGEIDGISPGLNASSGDQVAKALYGDLGLPAPKLTKGKGRPSTEDKYLQALLAEHPLVRLICEYRQIVKLQAIVKDILANTVEGRLYPRLNMAGTPTGRLACSDPNLMAIPKRSERGKQIRKAFRPPPGLVLGSWDLDQIEFRVLALESLDEGLLTIFREGRDPHMETGVRIFGEATDENRFRGKTTNFAIPMGITAQGLRIQCHKAQRLDVTDDDTQSWLDDWHLKAYPTASRFLHSAIDQCHEYGYVTCLGGRRRWLPGVMAQDSRIRERAGRQAMSFRMQAGAQYVMHRWEADVYRHLVETGPVLPVMQIHDDLVTAFPERHFDAIDQAMQGLLPQGFAVPITTKGQMAEHWGDL